MSDTKNRALGADGAGDALRVVFMGTPQFAVAPLEALAAAQFVDVVLVVTRPDAASGRGKALLPSPVKQAALAHGIEVLETKTLRTAEIQDRIAAARADAICVAAFGAIIPPEVLAMPRLDCLNVHASLLPRGRGAAPMQRDLLEGATELGYSIMRIEEGLDTGPYCVQGRVEVGEKVYDEVSLEVSEAGAAALVDVLARLRAGEPLPWVEQDDALATHADKIAKSEVRLDPAQSAPQNMHRVQASGEAAPARCTIAGRSVRVMRAHVVDDAEAQALQASGVALPSKGQVAVCGGRVLLGCGSGVLEALEVKPDGKRQMSAREFAAGIQGRRSTWEVV